MFISSPIYDVYEYFDDFKINRLLSLDFRDSRLNDFEQKIECAQELKDQVYYVNKGEEDLLAYKETSLDSSGMNALESIP
jgi:hypothetical protein